jgi:hypothetical protein
MADTNLRGIFTEGASSKKKAPPKRGKGIGSLMSFRSNYQRVARLYPDALALTIDQSA